MPDEQVLTEKFVVGVERKFGGVGARKSGDIDAPAMVMLTG